MKGEYVRKAGTMTYRENDEGKTEIMMIFREGYEDWTLPKGHVEEGEKLVETAGRETQEETGYTVEVGNRIESKIYKYKYNENLFTCEVFYFLAKPIDHDPDAVPNIEVDKAEWFEAKEAIKNLSYDTDKEIAEKGLKMLNS